MELDKWIFYVSHIMSFIDHPTQRGLSKNKHTGLLNLWMSPASLFSWGMNSSIEGNGGRNGAMNVTNTSGFLPHHSWSSS